MEGALRNVAVLLLLGCGGKDDAGTGDDQGTTDADADVDADSDSDYPSIDPTLPVAEVIVAGASTPIGDAGSVATLFTEPLGGNNPFTDAPPGDTCAYYPGGTTTTTTGTGTGTTGPSSLDPGEVTVAVDGQDVRLVHGAGLVSSWNPGAAVDFSATGNEIPAFDQAALVTLPAPPEPSMAAQTDGSIEFVWTAGGSGAYTSIILADTDGALVCIVDDDGAFTVSATDAAQVPTPVYVGMTRTTFAVQNLADVAVVGLASFSQSP